MKLIEIQIRDEEVSEDFYNAASVVIDLDNLNNIMLAGQLQHLLLCLEHKLKVKVRTIRSDHL